MATVYVDSDSFLDEVTYAEGDTIYARYGAVCTIRKSTTVKPGRFNASSDGVIKIDSSASGAVVPIVIEFVHNSGVGVNITNEAKLVIRGNWHDLGTGDGTAGQTFTFYSDKGQIPWVQVETGNGTNEWIDFISLGSTYSLSLTGAGETLGRFFTTSDTDGVITFGDGTNGMVPPNGARIRCPDIFITDDNSTIYAASSRTEFDSEYVGSWDIDTVLLSNRMQFRLMRTRYPLIKNVGCFGTADVTETLGGEIDGLFVAPSMYSSSRVGLTFTYNSSMSISNIIAVGLQEDVWKFGRCSGITANNIRGYLLDRNGSGDYSFDFYSNSNVNINNVVSVGGSFNFNGSNDVDIDGMRVSDQCTGVATTSVATSEIRLYYSGNITINDFALIAGGAPCYSGVFYLFSGNNLLVTNFDYDTAGHSYHLIDGSAYGKYIFARGTVGDTRSTVAYNTAISKNHYHFDIASPNNTQQIVATGRGCRTEGVACVSSSFSYAGSFDCPWFLMHTPADPITEGVLTYTFNQEQELSYFEYLGDSPRHNNINNLTLPAIGDGVVYEIPDKIVGVTGFKNEEVTTSGSHHYPNYDNYMSLEYSIKPVGGSWSSWLEASPANLSAETVSSDGFYMRIRVLAINYDQSSRQISKVSLGVTVDPTKQRDYLFADIVLNNIVVGSAYRVEAMADGSLIAEGTASATKVTITVPYNGDTDVVVKVRNSSGTTKYYPFKTGGTITSEGLGVYIAQIENPIAK